MYWLLCDLEQYWDASMQCFRRIGTESHQQPLPHLYPALYTHARYTDRSKGGLSWVHDSFVSDKCSFVSDNLSVMQWSSFTSLYAYTHIRIFIHILTTECCYRDNFTKGLRKESEPRAYPAQSWRARSVCSGSGVLVLVGDSSAFLYMYAYAYVWVSVVF